MNEARQNSGVDRHLLGLRLISQELDVKTPEIFKDLSWKKSGGDGNYILSSSCLGFTNYIGNCSPINLNGYSVFYCFPDTG